MGKHKVFELAKELMTDSKRIIEIFKEINIEVKTSMSIVDDEQKSALFKRLGVKEHEKEVKDTEVVEKEVKKEAVKKTGPTIIRKREVFIDNENTPDASPVKKKSYVKKSDKNAGLRPGLSYDEGPVLVKPKDKEKPSQTLKMNPVIEDDNAKEEGQKPMGPILIKKKPAESKEKKTEQEVEENTEKSAEPDKKDNTEIISTTADKKNDIEKEKSDEKKDDTIIIDIDRTDAIKTQEIKNDTVKSDIPVAAVKEPEEKAAAVKTGEIEKIAEKVTGKEENNTVKQPAGKPQSDKPVYQKDRARPPYQKDGTRPPYQKDGARPPYQRDGARPPYQKDGARPPYQRDGARPPYQKDGARPPYQKDGARPPYQKDGARPPYQRDGARPPYQKDGARPPYQKDGARPPYQRDGARPPYQKDGARPPFRKDGARPPYQKDNNGQGDLDIPVVAVAKDEPTRTAEELGISRAKEIERGVKREQKRDVKKPQPVTAKKIKPAAAIDKKGLKGIVAYGQDYDDLVAGHGKKRRNRKPVKEQPKYIPPVVVIKDLALPEEISVKELAEMLKKTSSEIIKKLMGLGLMATINTVLDFDTAALVLDEYGITANKMVIVSEEDILFDDDDDSNSDKLVQRDPVVVVMGHVDHGKTSLLDAIRDANVIEGEAGGITQHIGAYKVRINDRKICFLDTPGHEAFTSMRARGAQVTDIAVIVVAADDSVMPQTIEAVSHAKAAGVKIVVAINKIDKEGANPDRVKNEMAEHGVVPSAWGGDTEFVEISAKKRINIEELLEIIILEADILNLQADPDRQAKGTVIEAKLDKNKGPVATILVQRGTLKSGNTIVTGSAVGRIRAMTDDKGRQIKSAGPSTPVEIIGLPTVPEAGELFYAVTDEKMARQLAEKRRLEEREKQLKASSKVSLEELYAQIQEGDIKDLNIIVKADVQGSVEAVKQSMEKLMNDEVRVKVIHGGVGAISESDVTLAQVSNAIICGFNVRPGHNVAEMAQDAEVDIRLYRVIYSAIEDIQAAMKGMLKPTYKEVVLGHAEVRQVYKASGLGTIAGSYVLDGKITRNAEVRLVRDGIVIVEGKMNSLKRFKDDAKEVASGFECGITLEKYNDIKEGDVIEAFEMEEVKN